MSEKAALPKIFQKSAKQAVMMMRVCHLGLAPTARSLCQDDKQGAEREISSPTKKFDDVLDDIGP